MKKIVLWTALFAVVATGYSQKVFNFYNFSSFPVEIGGVVTKPESGGTYPFFDSSVFGLIPVSAGGGSYTLENTSHMTRFPFHSPASLPYITSWYRMTAPFTSITMPSNAAWVIGSDQEFHYVKFQVGTSGSLGGGNLGELGGSSQGEIIFGNGWTAIYSPSGLEYNCVIF